MLVISATNNILGPLHPQHLPLGCLVSSCLPATPAAYTWYPLYTLYKGPVLATISPLTLPLTSRCRGVLPSLRQPCCVHCPLCPPQYLLMLCPPQYPLMCPPPTLGTHWHPAPGSCVAPPGDQPLAATSSRQHTWHVGEG